LGCHDGLLKKKEEKLIVIIKDALLKMTLRLAQAWFFTLVRDLYHSRQLLLSKRGRVEILAFFIYPDFLKKSVHQFISSSVQLPS
jgi:hypothetical protein